MGPRSPAGCIRRESACGQLWGLDRSKSGLIDAVRTRFSEIVRIRKVHSVSGKIEMAAAAGDFAKVRELALEAYQQCDGGAGIGKEHSIRSLHDRTETPPRRGQGDRVGGG